MVQLGCQDKTPLDPLRELIQKKMPWLRTMMDEMSTIFLKREARKDFKFKSTSKAYPTFIRGLIFC
jgi:hypothetical protein